MLLLFKLFVFQFRDVSAYVALVTLSSLSVTYLPVFRIEAESSFSRGYCEQVSRGEGMSYKLGL